MAGVTSPAMDFASSLRLGVPDHPLDGRAAAAQLLLDRVDLLVYVAPAQGGVDQAVEVDDLAVVRLTHLHVVDLVELSNILRFCA
jgi:hypothetical protein